MSPEQVREAAALLSERGVWFAYAASPIGGMYSLTTADVVEILRDPDGLMARLAGVDRATLARWREREADRWQCTATTRAGRRCRVLVDVQPNEGYDPARDDRCPIHRERRP